ncbi:MAG: UDP-3-O-acyl-N-acetylglucosamine deacetylase [Hyphomonadaceae bacterium]|nr:UDP-3-O-acyl-N-acetylglucosamine deacetylase [Hyphomonadaceae bacterium]
MSSVEFQQTVRAPIMVAGVGVHSGTRARMVIHPAQPGTGIVFIRTDLDEGDGVIVARGDCVSDVKLGTTLANEDGVSLAVVEHLLAACSGMGLDNARIEIDGPEVPIMDGSAAVFCNLIGQVGLRQQAAPRRRIRILERVEIIDGAKRASLSPSQGNGLTLRAKIDFESRAIGVQEIALRLKPGQFARDIAFARTFGFARDVDYLKSMGLARGGSLDNAVVIDGDEIVNPEGLRAEDEFVRHKVLDAIGDLFLAGGQIAGLYEAVQPGHALNNALVRKLLETPSAWCWESDDISQSVASAVSAQA